LNTDGDYTKKIGPQANEAYTLPAIDESWFTTGPTAKDFTAMQWSSKSPKVAKPDTMVAEVKRFLQTGLPSTKPENFVLELNNQAGKIAYAIYKASGVTTVQEALGFTARQPAPICAGAELTGDTIVCIPTAKPGAPTIDGTLTIKLTANRPAAGERMQAHIKYGSISGLNPCDGVNRVKPYQFKIKFTAYDSDKYGQPTDQISIDPLSGQDAVKEQAFLATCADAEELKPVEEKVKGVIPSTQILGGLRNLFATHKTEEERLQGELQTAAYQELTNPTAFQHVKDIIGAILKTEIEFRDQIAQYDVQITPESPAPINEFDEVVAKTLNAWNELVYLLQLTSTKLEAIDTPTTNEEVLGIIRPVDESLTEFIKAKTAAIEALDAELPSAAECTTGFIPNEGYFECRPSCTPPFADQEVAGKTCTGLDICCGIPAANYCTGTKAGFNLQCQQGNKCDTGWNLMDDYFCEDPLNQVCCEQPEFGQPITPQDQLIFIKNRINSFRDSFASQIQQYEDKANSLGDQDASQYLAQQAKNTLKSELDQNIFTPLASAYTDLDGYLKKPLTGDSLVPQNAKSYISSLNIPEAAKNALKKKLDDATTPAQIKLWFLTVYTSYKDRLDEATNPIPYIDIALKIQPECPNAITGLPKYEQYACFQGSCPSDFFTSPLNKRNDWKPAAAYSCTGVNRVCCARDSRAVTKYKSWVDTLRVYPPEYTEKTSFWNPINPEQNVLSLLLIPYQEKGSITNFKYGVGAPKDSVADSQFDYDTYASQKLATLSQSYEVKEYADYNYEYFIGGNAYRHYMKFQVPCPTEKGRHRLASHGCLDSSGTRYPYPDRGYDCPATTPQKYCYREQNSREGCTATSTTANCKCYQDAGGNPLAGVSGTRQAGETPLESCRRICAQKHYGMAC